MDNQIIKMTQIRCMQGENIFPAMSVGSASGKFGLFLGVNKKFLSHLKKLPKQHHFSSRMAKLIANNS